MGEVEMVIAKGSLEHRKLFSSIVLTMESLRKYAVAKYIPRNNKNGVNPKLVALIPYREEG